MSNTLYCIAYHFIAMGLNLDLWIQICKEKKLVMSLISKWIVMLQDKNKLLMHSIVIKDYFKNFSKFKITADIIVNFTVKFNRFWWSFIVDVLCIVIRFGHHSICHDWWYWLDNCLSQTLTCNLLVPASGGIFKTTYTLKLIIIITMITMILENNPWIHFSISLDSKLVV